jgi:hypothetical protein
LGAIDGSWEKVEAILKEFTLDENQVVRESCLVALDAADYWGHSTSIDATSPDDDDDKDAAETKQAPLSFMQIKGRQDDGMKANHQILNQHFNVKG